MIKDDETPDGYAAIQRDLNILKKCTNRNLMKFNTGKCPLFLPLWTNNPML